MLLLFFNISSDGIVGEVLFWTLKQCLGTAYDAYTHFLWVKVMSRMLRIMVPVAVSFEISTGGVHQKRRVFETSAAAKASRSSISHNSSTNNEGDFDNKYGTS